MTRRTADILGGLILCAYGVALSGYPVKAQTACDIMADARAFYGSDRAYVYRFDGAEAAGIVGVIHDLFKLPLSRAVTVVWLGYDEDDGTSAWFFYDAEGCAVNRQDGWAPSDVISLLDALGIHPPIGGNYHQLPGMPLSRDGFPA